MVNAIVLSNENFYFRDMGLVSSANIAGQKQSYRQHRKMYRLQLLEVPTRLAGIANKHSIFLATYYRP